MRIFRFILILLLVAGFGWSAFYLFQKQRAEYSYRSFCLPDSEQDVFFSDVDRFLDKVRNGNDHSLIMPSEVHLAFIAAVKNKDFSFNRSFGKSMLYSTDGKDFVFAVRNPELSGSYLAEVIESLFGITVSGNSTRLTLNQITMNISHYGNYCVVSSKEIDPLEEAGKNPLGNPDYIVFDEGGKSDVHHILSKQYHFKVWEESERSFKGRAVPHEKFFSKAISGFDRLNFVGSKRIGEDLQGGKEDPELFAWIDEGLIVLKRDSFEIMLAPQNDQRDLRLILEERTLEAQSDTFQLNTFNIATFEILPFHLEKDWSAYLKELDSPMSYYTEYDNFNILANSIPAMRWYITEVQMGNFFFKDNFLSHTYQNTLPEQANQIAIYSDTVATQNLIIESHQTNPSSEIVARVVIEHEGFSGEAVATNEEYVVEIVPTAIQHISTAGGVYHLLRNERQLMLYNVAGERKWRLDLTTNLVQEPIQVDFENDGSAEWVLFQENQVDVVNLQGKSLPGFPFILNGVSHGGMAVNYDNGFNYRIFVSDGKEIKCLSEEGKVVNGWQFGGMKSGLAGKILYKQVQGKDFIVFSDRSGYHYSLNRRGESRFNKEIRRKLRNRTDFILGASPAKIRVMSYQSQYIYSLYMMDGAVDSVKLDEKVNPVDVRWINEGDHPLLLIEEANRILIVDEFGYTKEEVLKSNTTQEIVQVIGDQDFQYLFADNSQNSLYLRDRRGKLIFPQPMGGTSVLTLVNDELITFTGSKLKVYKIN